MVLADFVGVTMIGFGIGSGFFSFMVCGVVIGGGVDT